MSGVSKPSWENLGMLTAPYFLCVDCGSVHCLNDVNLTASSQRDSGKVAEMTEILLREHCNECR
ncbi:hypothetical protein [Novipirellula caenicola]